MFVIRLLASVRSKDVQGKIENSIMIMYLVAERSNEVYSYIQFKIL